MPMETSMNPKRSIPINYLEYNSADELPQDEKLLAIKAIEATKTSYSPYSEFAVGAAVLLQNGETILSSNQENGAYPSGMCAERVALFYAGSQFPDIPVKAIAIAANHKGVPAQQPIAPCGACRQVMIESQMRGKMPFKVVMVGEAKVIVVEDATLLLPFTFSNVFNATH